MALSVEQLVGYSFPFRKGANGYPAISRSVDVVVEAIETVIGTAKGERVMRPDFGCDIHKRIFQPNDERLAAVAASDIQTAVQLFVPGIDVLDVKAAPDGHRCTYSVRYREQRVGQIQTVHGEVELAQ